MGFLIKYFYYIPIHAGHAYIIPINHNELKIIPKIQIKETPEVFTLSFFNLIEDTSPKIPVHNPKIHPAKIQKIKNRKRLLIYIVLKKFSVNVINITNKINKTGDRIENKLNIKLAFFVITISFMHILGCINSRNRKVVLFYWSKDGNGNKAKDSLVYLFPVNENEWFQIAVRPETEVNGIVAPFIRSIGYKPNSTIENMMNQLTEIK